MLNKNDVILSAQTLGFFRAKKEEKREEIVEEMIGLGQFEKTDKEAILEILETETARRSQASQERAKRALAKAEADAQKPLVAGVESADAHVKEMPKGLYVVTTAQNNTPVDPQFFGALLKYCEANGAQLLIAKMTYNKNGFQQSQDATEGIYYVPEVMPYIIEGQIRLGGLIDFIGQANVLPTTKNPLTGFSGITPAHIDAIIPASKIALQCTAALKGRRGKVLYSTGACTMRNYIVRRAGAVAASEHNIGALVVDTRGDIAVVRQLERMPESAGFFDLLYYYTADHVALRTDCVGALQFGDIHAEKLTGENLQKMRELLWAYYPTHCFLHDVADFSSRNHHNVKDCTFIFNQHINDNTVEGDIKTVAYVIDSLADASEETLFHVVESNHDLAINTWLKNADFKQDPINALTYLNCMTALYKHIAENGDTDFNMLEYAYRNIGGGASENIVFHKTDESVMLYNIEHGCHGHTGANGSKGSPKQFRALGVPMNTGHTHTPSIHGGVYTAGVASSLEMGYNVGPSSWQLANILTYVNGQRQILFM